MIYNEERQFKLDKVNKQVADLHNKLKLLAIDKHALQKEKECLNEENELMKKNLDSCQNFDEVHIMVDMLGQSSQGIAIIQKQYGNYFCYCCVAVLLSQMAVQNEKHFEIDEEYREIEPTVTKINIIKQKLDDLKKVNEELHFNIARQKDMLPLISVYQERTKNNEQIVNNLKDSIETLVKAHPHNLQDTDKKLRTHYHERKKLEEKKIQMNLYQELYETSESKDAGLVEDNLLRIIGNDPMMNKLYQDRETNILNSYKHKVATLTETAEVMGARLDKIEREETDKKSKAILIDPQIKQRKRDLMSKLDNIGHRETVLVKQVTHHLM